MLGFITHLSWLTYAEIIVGLMIAGFGVFAIITAFGLIPAKAPPQGMSDFTGYSDRCDVPGCAICGNPPITYDTTIQ